MAEPIRSRAIYWLGYTPESQAKNNFLAGHGGIRCDPNIFARTNLALLDSPVLRQRFLVGLHAGEIFDPSKDAIGNIHDYMFALGDLEAGTEVAIEIDRGGKKLTIKVIPAPGR